MSFASTFADHLIKSPQRPLTQDEALTLMRFAFMSEAPVPDQQDAYIQFANNSMAMNIMHHRLMMHFPDIELSPPAIMWLASLADRPGTVVMLVTVVAWLVEQGHAVTLHSVTQYCFPEGVPTEESYVQAWDTQKITPTVRDLWNFPKDGSDNMLDYKECWQ